MPVGGAPLRLFSGCCAAAAPYHLLGGFAGPSSGGEGIVRSAASEERHFNEGHFYRRAVGLMGSLLPSRGAPSFPSAPSARGEEEEEGGQRGTSADAHVAAADEEREAEELAFLSLMASAEISEHQQKSETEVSAMHVLGEEVAAAAAAMAAYERRAVALLLQQPQRQQFPSVPAIAHQSQSLAATAAARKGGINAFAYRWAIEAFPAAFDSRLQLRPARAEAASAMVGSPSLLNSEFCVGAALPAAMADAFRRYGPSHYWPAVLQAAEGGSSSSRRARQSGGGGFLSGGRNRARRRDGDRRGRGGMWGERGRQQQMMMMMMNAAANGGAVNEAAQQLTHTSLPPPLRLLASLFFAYSVEQSWHANARRFAAEVLQDAFGLRAAAKAVAAEDALRAAGGRHQPRRRAAAPSGRRHARTFATREEEAEERYRGAAITEETTPMVAIPQEDAYGAEVRVAVNDKSSDS